MSDKLCVVSITTVDSGIILIINSEFRSIMSLYVSMESEVWLF